jgi:peptidoglycan-N-acetylglucosamine deacetylase
MRFFRPPLISRLLYPDALFRIRTEEKRLVLTFDDGPDPDSTIKLAGILEKHGIKAIFFCSGRKAEELPELVEILRSKGHVIGNHGYDHLNGCRTPAAQYSANAGKAALITSDEFFRPPYGTMKIAQYRELKGRFRIFLWDVMPYDFDNNLTGEECLHILKKKIRPGSVIVLHDSGRSSVLSFIESFLIFAREEGYSFTTDI